MKSIVVFNNKGGVGKTTLLCNLAAFLGIKKRKKVLIIDADPQCNGRLSIQRPAVLLRWVFGSSPPNRTYTSPRIRLSTNNINLSIVTEFFVALTTYGNSLSFASHHLFFAGSFPLKIF